MNIRRALFALPFLFLAASAAEACSSSSTPGGTGGDGGGGSATGTCATLAACCSKLGTNAAACETEASANNQGNCMTTLAGAGSMCSGVTSSSTSSSTGTGVGTSSSSGVSGGSTTGSGTGGNTSSTSSGASGAGTCTSPSTTLPVGFSPPTALIANANTSCTAAQASGWGACIETPPTTDAGNQACDNYVGVPDGNTNNCGACIFSPYLIPGSQAPTAVGLNLEGVLYGTAGDMNSLYGANFGPLFGSCILGTGDAAAAACGKDWLAFDYCRFAVCEPLCPVTQADLFSTSTTTPADVQAFITCLQAAESGACAQYETKAMTDCATVVNDAGTDPVSKCNTLLNLDDNEIDGSKPTAASQTALIGAVCGGADAGL